MKFIVLLAVLIALALGVQSSVISLNPILITTDQLPVGSIAIQTSWPVGPIALTIANPSTPSPPMSSTPQPAVPEDTVVTNVNDVVPPEGSIYTAKTRGAVHVAPLPGHSTPATLLNEQPAPGTE